MPLTPAHTAEAIGAGTTSVAVDVALTGLTTGTTYYFRVAGTNSSGTTRGSILSFTPGSAPTVATLAATSVGATTATLNGNVTPNGLATEAWFVWGTSSTLAGGTSTTHEAIGAGTSAVAVDVALTGLTTGTTYYYRVVASNSSGTTSGTPILSFTPGAAPAATTVAASFVGDTTATLNGNVTPNGLATEAWFEWGTASDLAGATSTTPEAIGAGTDPVAVDLALTGLTPGTTYYFRVVASNSTGTTTATNILSFVPVEWVFTATGSFTTGRAWHNAVLLNDNSVLVAGGYHDNVTLDSAQLYDADAGTFSAADTMVEDRHYFTATLLANGNVLLAGGRTFDGPTNHSSAELYDADADTFTATGSMSITRWLHTATRLADGKVLITGGIGPSFVTSLTAELYDPDAGTFSAVGPMGAARYNHTATLLANGKVLITGGVGAAGTALATAELYDPDTQTFSATGALVVARQQQTATILANGNVLIVGGLNKPL